MTVRRRDLLFENVWQTFALDPFAKAAFLESLESFILSDQLRNLPVSITQEFVNHYETVSRLQALEACLTHISVASLDIHQVMNVCWLQGLFDGIIYVYNNGMLDYVSPAEELLGVRHHGGQQLTIVGPPSLGLLEVVHSTCEYAHVSVLALRPGEPIRPRRLRG